MYISNVEVYSNYDEALKTFKYRYLPFDKLFQSKFGFSVNDAITFSNLFLEDIDFDLNEVNPCREIRQKKQLLLI